MSLGVSQGPPKTEVVLWGRPGMVLGGPWGGFGGPGRSLGQSWEVRMLYFFGCTWFSKMSFFFHTYLNATLSPRNTKNHIVSILKIGGQHVAILLVLAMIREIHVFARVRFP